MMNRRKIVSAGIVLLCPLFLLWIASPAHAQIANVAMGDLYISVMNACEGWLVKAGDIALKLLAVTAVIGFAIGMKDLVLSGNLTMDGIVALLVRYAFIVGLLVWLLNAPQKLAMIPASIKKIGTTISGQDISYGGLIDLFSEVVNPIVEFTNGLGWTDIGLIICMTFIIFLINCLFFMISSTVLVVEIEAVFILIGGLFTASFFVIGYFRDSFLSYIKALAAVGVKMLMLCLCLGIMRNIMSTWPGMIAAQLDNAESIFTFLMPMSCALLGFYMLVKSVPQFASSIMSGGASSLDGGMIHAAAAAGYGLGMSVIKSSRSTARGIMGAGSTVTQAAQTYKYTSQAARDTGSTPGEARMAGAKEAFKTIMTGPQPGGSYGAGDRMYQDHQRAAQFADARNGGSNSLGSPPASDSGAGSHSDSAPVNSSGESGRTTSAGTYVSPSSQSLGFAPSVNAGRAAEMNRENRADAREAMGSYGSSETDSWGSYASDRKTNEGEGANER